VHAWYPGRPSGGVASKRRRRPCPDPEFAPIGSPEPIGARREIAWRSGGPQKPLSDPVIFRTRQQRRRRRLSPPRGSSCLLAQLLGRYAPSDGLTDRGRLAGTDDDRVGAMADPERQTVPSAVLVRRQRGLELGPKLPVPYLEGDQ